MCYLVLYISYCCWGNPLLIKSYFPTKNHVGSLQVTLLFTCLGVVPPLSNWTVFLKKFCSFYVQKRPNYDWAYGLGRTHEIQTFAFVGIS
jgi:hypothetical protein